MELLLLTVKCRGQIIYVLWDVCKQDFNLSFDKVIIRSNSCADLLTNYYRPYVQSILPHLNILPSKNSSVGTMFLFI